MVSYCTCYSVSAVRMSYFFCVCHKACLSDIQYKTTLLDKEFFIQKLVICENSKSMCCYSGLNNVYWVLWPCMLKPSAISDCTQSNKAFWMSAYELYHNMTLLLPFHQLEGKFCHCVLIRMSFGTYMTIFHGIICTVAPSPSFSFYIKWK